MKTLTYETNHPERLAVLLLLAVGGLLGASAILAKAAVAAGWPPLGFLQWSMLGAATLQLALAGQARAGFRPTLPLLAYLAGSGFLFAAANALAFAAVAHVGAGFVALCFAFPLVVTYALALALDLERLRIARLAGVLIGVAGAALLAGDAAAAESEAGFWALAALAAPIVIGAANIYRSRFWPSGVAPALLSLGMMAFGFATLAAITLGFGLEVRPAVWTSETIALLAAQTLLFTALYDLYMRLQKLAGPVYLSQIGSVGAAVGVALAHVVFGEVPGPLKLAAAGAIAAGVVLVSMRSAPSGRPARQPG